ncbi:MAG: peroxiredoxin [Myxococcota bacterium]
MLRPGDKAPDFEAIGCRGQLVRLSDFRGKKRVVLFFFPKAFTPACTLEVRHFRDHHEKIAALNAELIGVSVDKSEKNCRFAEAEGLQFTLIGDESRAISEKYGVVWPVLKIDRRATFVIDEQGVVVDVFHHEIQVYKHLDDVLARLASPGAPSGAA